MTERPEDIQRRLHGLDEIGEVVGALRGIAASHVAASREAIAAITAYAATVAGALARAMPVPPAAAAGPGLVVVVGASQGFSGAYPARLAEAAQAACPPGAGLLVLGQRTLAMLGPLAAAVLWSDDLPGHVEEVPALASRLTDALLRAAPAHPGPIRVVGGRDLPGQPAEARRIWPPAAPAAPPPLQPPLTSLPAAVLWEGLLNEALFSAVTLAVTEGLRAENQARVETMARAQSNLRAKRTEVEQAWRQARQDQMTTELIELTMGREAG